MIIVTNISKMKREYDENWAIVRSMKSKSDWITQVTDLSPSSDLFFWYRRLANEGRWNKEAFDNEYVPRFLRELKNKQAMEKLDYLFNADQSGKTISSIFALYAQENMCHRSIIAGILAGAGCNVQTDTGELYADYFDRFMALPLL